VAACRNASEKLLLYCTFLEGLPTISNDMPSNDIPMMII